MSKSFKQHNELSPTTAMVVDSLNLAFRWKHQKALSFKDEFINTVESLRRSYCAEKVFILSDWGSEYRKSVYPEYKQNRKDLQDQQTEEERAYFEAFFEEYLDIVEHYKDSKYVTLRIKGVEADDIAAYITCNMESLGLDTVWLISSDRDWDLLVKPGVSRFSYVTRKEVTIDNWTEHYDVSQEEYISLKCLTGDPGDNVPGIAKVGPVTAKKLINLYGSALDVAANIPLPGKYVYIKNTNDFGSEAIMTNYKLMDLVTFHRDAIGDAGLSLISEQLTEKNYV